MAKCYDLLKLNSGHMGVCYYFLTFLLISKMPKLQRNSHRQRKLQACVCRRGYLRESSQWSHKPLEAARWV